MGKSLRTLLFASAAVALLTLAAPTLAHTIRGTGAYAHFDGANGSPMGIAVVNRSANGEVRYHGAFVGLLPYLDQNVIGRSIDCTGTPAADNRVFRVRARADDAGRTWATKPLAPNTNLDGLKSVWSDQGGAMSCVDAADYVVWRVAAGDVNGDGAVGIWDKEHVLSLVKTGAGTLTIVVDGLAGDDLIGFRGVSAKCGSPAPAAATVFTRSTSADYSSDAITISQEQLKSLRSVRVRNMTTGVNLGCFPLSIIMANTEGD